MGIDSSLIEQESRGVSLAGNGTVSQRHGRRGSIKVSGVCADVEMGEVNSHPNFGLGKPFKQPFETCKCILNVHRRAERRYTGVTCIHVVL